MSAQFTVVLPDGVVPGQSVQATTPDGQTVQVMVPAQATPGQQIAVQYTPVTQPGGQRVPVAVMAAPPQQMPMLPQHMVDPPPNAQMMFMFGWLLGFVGVPCVCCSTCAGYVLNRFATASFIKTRRDQESAK